MENINSIWDKIRKVWVPCSQNDIDKSSKFKPGEICSQKTTGIKNQRSAQQNRWIHAIINLIAENTEDPNWNTPQKAKVQLKYATGCFGEAVLISAGTGTMVYYPLKSWSFDKMEHMEATKLFDKCVLEGANFLGCTPEQLLDGPQNE